MNHPQTYITAPDNADKILHEATPPPTQPSIEIPYSTGQKTGNSPKSRSTTQHRGRWYGSSLAWRGACVLSTAFGISGAWFIAAWVHYDRMPIVQPQHSPMGSTPDPILPPEWLLAVVGLLVLTSTCMMLLGTQDNAPKLKFKKDIQE